MSRAASLQLLAGTVAARVLLNAHRTSRLLTELGIPHALVGGLAVGAHGHPRATKDVDFLVGAAAYERTEPFLVFREELKDVARVGVTDLLAVVDHAPVLKTFLYVPSPGVVPLIPIEALILMKLDAYRPQDRADVVALFAAGADRSDVFDFLSNHAPQLVTRLTATLKG